MTELHDHPLVWPLGKPSAIAYVDNVFDSDFCKNFIKMFEDREEESHYGKTMGGIKLNIKVTDDWYLNKIGGDDVSCSLMRQEFTTHLTSKLWRVFELYRQSFEFMRDDVNSIVSNTGYQIQRYRKNIGYYSTHTDGSPWLPINKRVLGVVVYLNTVEQGGGTLFPLHEFILPAVEGRVSVFPAYWTHPHGSQMPMSNDKWIISTFVECGFGQGGCTDPNCTECSQKQNTVCDRESCGKETCICQEKKN